MDWRLKIRYLIPGIDTEILSTPKRPWWPWTHQHPPVQWVHNDLSSDTGADRAI